MYHTIIVSEICHKNVFLTYIGIAKIKLKLFGHFSGRRHFDSGPFLMAIFFYQNEIYLLVPSAPADIKAVTSASSSVIVSWRTPAQPNGVIQKYTVYRREIISGKEVINSKW